MNRRPVYSFNRDFRVISTHGGRWLVQRHFDVEGTPTVDPWKNIRRPTHNRAGAISLMEKLSGDVK